MLLKMEPAPDPSWQAAPGLVAQSFQRQHPFHWRIFPKLPTGKQFHTRDLARRRHFRGAFDRALHIRHGVKRFPKHLFLFNAVRTPVEAVHPGLLRCQALRERIVLVISVVPASYERSCQQDQDAAVNEDFLRPSVTRTATALFLPFPPFFRHAHPYITTILHTYDQATTLSAPGSTTNSSQCSVSTSPSTMTSMGASRLNSMRCTPLRSASGCSICVPS